jgi:hypothetical protein
MMTPQEPQVGQHYRSVGSAFRNAAWILTEIFTSRDGIHHARLTSTHDSTERRTLALSVVADTRRFTLAEAIGKRSV